MRHLIIVADTEAEVDAAPAGDIERATLVLIRDGNIDAPVRVFKSRHGTKGATHFSLESALETEGSHL